MENKVFEVDGISYDVYVPAGGIKRSVAILDGSAASRGKAGNMIFDTIGTYYNYTIDILRNNENLEDYDRLHQALRNPSRREHVLKIPFGQSFVTYTAYVANIDDTLQAMRDDGNYWDGMSVKFTAVSPNETPEGDI